MSSISAALGAGVSFEHDGRTYSVSLITQEVKADLEKRLVGRAMAVLEAFRDILPPKEFTEESVTLFREVKAGKYAFHGELCQAAVAGGDSVYFVSRLLGISEAELERLALEAGPKIVAAINAARALSEASKGGEGGEKNDPAAAPKR